MNISNIKIAKTLRDSAMLIEKSAAEIEFLRKEKDDLQIQNARLQLSLTAIERSRRSEELAELMFKKGMISRGDVLNKAKEIMTYDDKAFSILKETVEAAQVKPEESIFSSVDNSEAEKEVLASYDRGEESRSRTINKVLSL